MFDTFLEFIKRMGIFLICAESILHFAPGNSYQKYIRVLIGLMLLTQFLIPVKAILTGEDMAAIENRVNEFRVELESMTAANNSALIINDQHKIVQNSIADEVKSRLNNISSPEDYDFLVTDVEINNITYVTVKLHFSRPHNHNHNHNIEAGETFVIDDIVIDNIGKVELGNAAAVPDNPEHAADALKKAIAKDLRQIFARELSTGEEYLEVIIVE